MIPDLPEAKCPRCGMEAEGNFEVHQLFGFRVDKGHTYPQSHCKECRRKVPTGGSARVGHHLQRRGILRPGQIGWLHAETCWCMPIEPGRPIWSYRSNQHFRWSVDPDSTFD